MFGFFKKKIKNSDIEKFVSDVANVASEFEASVGEVDPGVMHLALDRFLENSEENSNFTAADHYFEEFATAYMQATSAGNVPLNGAVYMFSLTQNYILSSNKYQTKQTIETLRMWKLALSRTGGAVN